MRLLFSALLAVFITAPLLAQPLNGFSFSHKDWEVSCDNTGTCRAAGYGVNSGEVGFLLTRQAGLQQHVNTVATFAQIENSIPDNASVSLFIADQNWGALKAQDKEHFRLDGNQIIALIQALTHDMKIEIALNGQRKTLSSADANATFLKIDESQQRTGTKDVQLLQTHPATRKAKERSSVKVVASLTA